MKGLIHTTQQFAEDHAPEILTSVGIIGAITSVILAVRATPKAIEMIKEANAEKPVDKIKAAWTAYIPTGIATTATIGCMVASNVASHNKIAAASAAATMYESAYFNSLKGIKKLYGEDGERNVRKLIASEKAEKVDSPNVTPLPHMTLYLDDATGQTFYSDMIEINKRVNSLNRRIISNNYASWNEWNGILGLDNIQSGFEYGWNVDDGELEIVELGAVKTKDGLPAIAIGLNVPAHSNYVF